MCRLYQTIVDHQTLGDQHAVLEFEASTTWQELGRGTEQRILEWKDLAHASVGLVVGPRAESIAALAALDRLRTHVTLLSSQVTQDVLSELAEDLGWSARLEFVEHQGWQRHEVGRDHSPVAPGITILTSGTEGRAKPIHHTWQSLFRPYRRVDDGTSQRWLLAYQLQLYAGLQVLVQCLANGGCLVMHAAQAPVDRIIRHLRRAGTTHASATPSYWRRLLLFDAADELRQVPLRQITLGGEPVDQLLLDELRLRFPQARLTHIYATTELGRCFSVDDGREGFPVSYLTPGSLPDVELRLRDGELLVRSSNAAPGLANTDEPGETNDLGEMATNWVPTGDLVRVEGDRVLFEGRRSDLINVGGHKVLPLTVETVLRAVPGIRDVVVYAQSSSLAGHLVACDVMMEQGATEIEVQAAIRRASEARLMPHAWPRIVRFVSQIDLTEAGKRRRKALS